MNLLSGERASCDKRPNFLDWLFRYELATGEKKKKQVKMTNGSTEKGFSL